ncbi:MAG: tetratricopeptide repeat protein [Bacteroidota bacterium]
MKLPISIFFVLIVLTVFAQNNKVDSLTVLLNSTKDEYEAAKINLELAKLYERIDIKKGKRYALSASQYTKNDSLNAETANQLGRLFFFTAQLDSANFYFEKAKQILTGLNDERRVAILNIGIGAIQLRLGNYNKTIKILTKSAAYFEETGDKLNTAKCYTNISTALAELENYEPAIEYNEKALQLFREQSLIQFQLITLPNLAAQNYKNGDTLKAINYNLEAEKLALKMGNKRSLSIIYNNLGSIYLDSNPQKAKDYLEKTIALKNELNLKSGIEVAQGNLGYLSLINNDFEVALYYYKQVEEQVNGKQLVFACNQIQKCYAGLNQYDLALQYSEKARILNDSLLSAENQKVFNEIQTKYETEKKEKEILELQTSNLEVNHKRIQNQIFLFISLGFLLAAFSLIYFILKNAKRKQILVQQELKIKNQELAQRLKTQELNGIDAIIDAQEKERTRIANDLHDNLGSRIATLKLYINQIANQNTENNYEEKNQLLSQLKNLADETYKEVRKIAHNKNTGTLINKGLIPSMNFIANQISDTEKLKVEVENINVNQRIKNNIEIQVFRIIQELLTNIIKHAGATEGTIQFSEDNNILNVMVEDNGKGFDLNKTDYGFGLNNIEKRIENINGNFVIDSTPGNGTTAILTIPL